MTQRRWLVGARRLPATLAGGFRDVVWSDVREGLPRIGDLAPTPRMLGMFGIAAIVAVSLQLYFVDDLRAASPLVAGHADFGGRPQLVPLALVPLTVVTLVISWTYLLAGAAHSHGVVRVAVTAMYVATTLTWLTGPASAVAEGRRAVAVAAVGLTTVVTLLARRLPGPRFAPLFLVTLALVGLAYGGAALPASRELLNTAEAPVVTLGLLLSLARGIGLPLFVLVGLGLAVSAYRVARWVGDTAGASTSGTILPLVLGVLAAGAVLIAVTALAAAVSAGRLAGAGGALLSVLLPLAVWAVARRRLLLSAGLSQEAEIITAAEGAVSVAALAYFAPLVLATLLLLTTSAVSAVIQLSGGLGLPMSTEDAVNLLVDRSADFFNVYRGVFSVLAAAAAVATARRRPALSVYLLVLAVATAWTVAVSGPLAGLRWDDASQIAAWLTVGVLVRLVVDLRRGLLPPHRQRNYVVALGIIVLFAQVDFLDSPFNPVFAFAGVTFVVIAVAVDMLTLGRWANSETVWFPRTSRLLLYLGYALFSLALVVWAAATHDFEQFNLYTGEAGAIGLRLFGDPLLLVIIATLVLPPPPPAAPSGTAAGVRRQPATRFRFR